MPSTCIAVLLSMFNKMLVVLYFSKRLGKLSIIESHWWFSETELYLATDDLETL
jgi:hypothetical protein